MISKEICQGAACTTALLDDSPTSEDSFRHAEISKAIAELILTEKGGRAIALTGAWGSGKSTVVKLLAEELKKSTYPVRLVTFDAWAHQGDPLRRTFIEHAMQALEDWRPRQNSWDKRIAILSRRWSETVTHAKPQLSFLGALGAFALLISPAANQLFGLYSKPELKISPYLVWTLFALGAFPLLLACIILVVWLVERFRGNKTPLPSLIYSSSENRTTTSTSKTPEPTSIEFAEAYRELLRDSIGGANRRVIFVIDNLDRINDDEAKAIWGTLKAFFDTPLHSENWYSRVWILVPFDEGAVVKLWGQYDSEKLAHHFIEKTFQAFFRVPSTQLSSWERYFYQQLKLAFPLHSDPSEQLTIFRIFDALRTNQEAPPTPRQIKLFLNTLGSLHRQWRGTVPLPTQAAFTISVAKGKEFVLSLQRSNGADLLPYDLGARLSETWQRDMAAMHFNVSIDAAFETLIGYPIRNALSRGDGKALEKLENGSGFSQVLTDTFERHYTVRSTSSKKT